MLADIAGPCSQGMLDLPILPGHGPRCVRSCQMVKGDDTEVPESPRMAKVDFLGPAKKKVKNAHGPVKGVGWTVWENAVARGTPPALGNYTLRSGSVPRGSQITRWCSTQGYVSSRSD